MRRPGSADRRIFERTRSPRGAITTERYASHLADQGAERVARVTAEMVRLHPVGRVGNASGVASAVAYLLPLEASFIDGVILPVDGGRAVLGQDPEESGS